MVPEFRNEKFSVVLCGASKRRQPGTCYGDDIRALLDRVWPVLRQHKIPNRGRNHVVYGPNDDVFAGVEADVADAASIGLENREVQLDRYIYGKHVGPYNLLPGACELLRKWVESQGYRPVAPLVEIYGHWTDDQSKLEIEMAQAFE